MIKVVIVQEYVPRYRGRFFELLREQLAQQGIDTVVAAGLASPLQGLRGDATANGFVRIPQKELRIFGKRLTVRNTMKVSAKANLIIMEQARRNIDAYRVLLPWSRSRVAFWGHGSDFVKSPSRIEAFLLKKLTNRGTWFFGYTDSSVDRVCKQGFNRDRTTVVWNSTDTVALRKEIEAIPSIAVDRFRKELDLGDHTVLFIGALDPSKRIDVLLEIGDSVADRIPSFRMLVAGDGPLRRDLETLETESTWLKCLGPVDGQVKALAMTVARAIVIPGRVGLVATDSFAASLPIITTRLTDHAPEFEYLRPDLNSIVVQGGSEAMADAVVEILTNDALRDKLTAGASESMEKFSVEAMVENFAFGVVRATSK